MTATALSAVLESGGLGGARGALATDRPDPVEIFLASDADGFFWEQPEQRIAIVGLGETTVAPGHGIRVGALPFDDRAPDGDWRGLPGRAWWAPQLVYRAGPGSACWKAQGDSAALARLVREAADRASGPDREPTGPFTIEEPDEAHWEPAVRTVLDQIARGQIRKVVLARRRILRAQTAFPVGPVLRRLRARFSSATIFAVRRDGRCFLGASPERLVRVCGRDVETVALAGSAPPDDPRELLNDPKERLEHALVVEAIREALAPICQRLEIPDAPIAVQLPNIRHLATPIRGRLTAELGALAVAERLHPTPAVAGVPRAAALALLRELEPFARHWYAAPVGWIDESNAGGDGEFAVALRSALLAGNRATLFAGSGIVAGSCASREWDETGTKLEVMQWALTPPAP